MRATAHHFVAPVSRQTFGEGSVVPVAHCFGRDSNGSFVVVQLRTRVESARLVEFTLHLVDKLPRLHGARMWSPFEDPRHNWHHARRLEAQPDSTVHEMLDLLRLMPQARRDEVRFR